jgi:hypothetical protein
MKGEDEFVYNGSTLKSHFQPKSTSQKNNTNRYIYFLHLSHKRIETMSKAEKTRAFIIEKAAPIFNMKGFAGTSMADLTEATGLTKGAIYGNFENKDEVALAVYDYNLSLVVQGLRRSLQSGDVRS